jgi:hypothetical protein
MGEMAEAIPMPAPPMIRNMRKMPWLPESPVPSALTVKRNAAASRLRFRPKRSDSQPENRAPGMQPISAELIISPCIPGSPAIPKKRS